MQVLKFGGTSVANAENISKVIQIVKSSVARDKREVVVSALGGITDILLEASAMAAEGNLGYKEKLQLVKSRHLWCVEQLLAG